MSKQFCMITAILDWVEERLRRCSSGPKIRDAIWALGKIAESGNERALEMLWQALKSDSPPISMAAREEVARLSALSPDLAKSLECKWEANSCVSEETAQQTEGGLWHFLLNDSRPSVRAIAALHMVCGGNAEEANIAMQHLKQMVSRKSTAPPVLSALTSEVFRRRVSEEILEQLLPIAISKASTRSDLECAAHLAMERGIKPALDALKRFPYRGGKLALLREGLSLPDKQRYEMLLGFLSDKDPLTALEAAKHLVAYSGGNLPEDVADKVAGAIIEGMAFSGYTHFAPIQLLIQAIEAMSNAGTSFDLESLAGSNSVQDRVKAAAIAAVTRDWKCLERLAKDKCEEVPRIVAIIIPNARSDEENEVACRILCGLVKSKDYLTRQEAFTSLGRFKVSRHTMAALGALVFSRESHFAHEAEKGRWPPQSSD